MSRPVSISSLVSPPSPRCCFTCLQVLPQSYFSPAQWSLAKLNSQCAVCESAGPARKKRHRKEHDENKSASMDSSFLALSSERLDRLPPISSSLSSSLSLAVSALFDQAALVNGNKEHKEKEEEHTNSPISYTSFPLPPVPIIPVRSPSRPRPRPRDIALIVREQEQSKKTAQQQTAHAEMEAVSTVMASDMPSLSSSFVCEFPGGGLAGVKNVPLGDDDDDGGSIESVSSMDEDADQDNVGAAAVARDLAQSKQSLIELKDACAIRRARFEADKRRHAQRLEELRDLVSRAPSSFTSGSATRTGSSRRGQADAVHAMCWKCDHPLLVLPGIVPVCDKCGTPNAFLLSTFDQARRHFTAAQTAAVEAHHQEAVETDLYAKALAGEKRERQYLWAINRKAKELKHERWLAQQADWEQRRLEKARLLELKEADKTEGTSKYKEYRIIVRENRLKRRAADNEQRRFLGMNLLPEIPWATKNSKKRRRADGRASGSSGSSDSSDSSSDSESASVTSEEPVRPVPRKRKPPPEPLPPPLTAAQTSSLNALQNYEAALPYSEALEKQLLSQEGTRATRIKNAPSSSTVRSSPLSLPLLIRSIFGLDEILSATHPDKILPKERNAKYENWIHESGTLKNGRVYVAISSLHSNDDREAVLGPSSNSYNGIDRGAGDGKRARTRSSSSVDNDWPMLGLFAGHDIKEGEVVTCYGGTLLEDLMARRKPRYQWTHIRRIRDSSFVKDGRLYSLLFNRLSVDKFDQFNLNPRGRKRLMPFTAPVHIIKILSDEGLAKQVRAAIEPLLPTQLSDRAKEILSRPIDQLTASGAAQLDPRFDLVADNIILTQEIAKPAWRQLAQVCEAIAEHVGRGGMGFMANTAHRAAINVRVVEVNPSGRNRIGPNEMFYIATRDIPAHTEILAPYNNVESKRYTGGPQPPQLRKFQRKGKQSESESESEEGAEAEESEAAEAAQEKNKEQENHKEGLKAAD